MTESAEEKIKVFVSSSCGPCQRVKNAISEGKFNIEEVDLIDLETEEGFPYIEKFGLNRVPAAFKGKQQCDLLFSEEGDLIINCDESE
jgi:glutaredoxin